MALRQRYSIGDLVKEFGVTARTLRFYEDQGLLQPERRGVCRSYSRADRARLAWILRGRAVGFSLAEIRELLDLYAPGPARRPQLQAALRKCQEKLQELNSKRHAIDHIASELEQFIATLQTQLNVME
ncbi:MerR family transcriptional regulator [Thermaurantiacus sp.]